MSTTANEYAGGNPSVGRGARAARGSHRGFHGVWRAARSLGGVLFSLGLGLLLTGCELLQQVQISRAGASYFEPEIEGFVESDEQSNGTRIDLENTIDFGDDSAIGYRGTLAIGQASVDVRYLDHDLDAQVTLAETVRYGEQTFATGSMVDADYELTYLDIRSRFPITAIGPVSIDGQIGFEYVKNDVKIVSGQDVAEEGFDQWFPTLGLGGSFVFPLGEDFRIFVDGDVAVLPWPFLDVDGFYLDATARAGIQASFISVGAGWRRIDFDLEDKAHDFEMDYRLEGPFLFGELVF